jgi:MFS family permease
MLPGSLVSIVAMPIASKLYSKIGEKLVAVMGVVTISVGSIPFILATPETPILLLTSVQCVRCFGLAMVNLVSTNAQMSAVPPELSGHASALTNWSHQMLNALTVALAGSIAELRVAHISGAEGGSLALAYTSTTNLMMLASCVLLMLMIPIALKFYRNKNEC